MEKMMVLCVVNATCWIVAPIVGRYSGLGAMPMAFFVGLGTFLAASPAMFLSAEFSFQARPIALGLGAGILNGLGIVAFYALVAGSAKGLWELSQVVPIVYVLVPIGVAVLGLLLFGEVTTGYKVAGLALAGLAIWCLS